MFSLHNCRYVAELDSTSVSDIGKKKKKSVSSSSSQIWQSGRVVRTDRMRSPLRSSPQRSAGPPARMKEIKIPSPSSPPTMLKPRPVDPRWSTTRLGSLQGNTSSAHELKLVAAKKKILVMETHKLGWVRNNNHWQILTFQH